MTRSEGGDALCFSDDRFDAFSDGAFAIAISLLVSDPATTR